MSDAPGSAEPEQPRLVGVLFRRRASEPTPPVPPAERPAPSDRFRLTRRGYDPREVDDRLAALQGELEQLRVDVREIGAERDAVQRAAARLRDEVTRLSARLEAERPEDLDGDLDTPTRLGPLGNRTARLAQREAQLIVATARKEAAEIVRTARVQAARDRDVADRLIGARLAELARQSEAPASPTPLRDAP